MLLRGEIWGRCFSEERSQSFRTGREKGVAHGHAASTPLGSLSEMQHVGSALSQDLQVMWEYMHYSLRSTGLIHTLTSLSELRQWTEFRAGTERWTWTTFSRWSGWEGTSGMSSRKSDGGLRELPVCWETQSTASKPNKWANLIVLWLS